MYSSRAAPGLARRGRIWLAACPLVVVLAGPGTPAWAVTGPPLPHLLPPAGVSHIASGHAGDWIIGVDARDQGQADRVAITAQARRVPGLPAYIVSVAVARRFARLLLARGILSFSEPDGKLEVAQASGTGSLTAENAWRSYIVGDGLTVPAPGPILALVDSQAQVGHPAFARSHITSTRDRPPTDEHGTATAAVAAAADTGLGFQGIYPGANALNIPTNLSCADAARRIVEAIRRHAAVLNMSFGSPQSCFLLYLAVMEAVAHDVLPVAAAGNEYTHGNPLSYPASYPHVLTVGAIGPDEKPAFFSTSNLGVDLAAPGLGIVTAVPKQFDTDGNRDGYQALSGTSFAAPMVAGAATWIRAVRPNLSGQQVADLLRLTAQDIWKKGYDTDTGYGLPKLGAALAAPDPSAGPPEPNDDIPFVDGRLFGRPDPPIWAGGAAAHVSNVVDVFKNPADVFRLSVPAHRRFHLNLRILTGTAKIAVYPGRARALSSPQIRRIAGIRTDRSLTIFNHAGRQIFYVAVGAQSVVAAYRLRVTS